MITTKHLLEKLEKVKQMTLDLRDNIFYGGVKNKGNEMLDEFNKILWEIEVPLKNGINELDDAKKINAIKQLAESKKIQTIEDMGEMLDSIIRIVYGVEKTEKLFPKKNVVA